MSGRRGYLVSWSVLLCLGATMAAGQQPRFPLSKLGVDMISVKGGHRLLGVLAGEDDQVVSFVVERAWLRRTLPKLYAQYAAAEDQQRTVGEEKLISRHESWKRQRADDVGLVVYIDKQLANLNARRQQAGQNPAAQAGGQDDQFQFMLLRFKRSEVVRRFAQPGTRKRLALLAWKHNLKDVTARSAASLSRELKEAKVATKEQVDLRDRLPNWNLDDRRWAAHVALVEYRLRQQLNYQGTDDFLVQTGDQAQPADLQKIFMRMLTDELNSKLAQLLEKPAKVEDKGKWKQTAIEGARQARVTGVRVARLKQNNTTGRVEVNVSFLARMPDDNWEVAYEHTTTAQAARQDAAQRQKIAVAPEVKKVLDIAKAAGLDPNDKKIQLALQFGSAAGQAQTKALKRFEDHLTRIVDPR